MVANTEGGYFLRKGAHLLPSQIPRAGYLVLKVSICYVAHTEGKYLQPNYVIAMVASRERG